MRTCGRCKEEKPLKEFRKRGLGHSTICKPCIIETSDYRACKHCGTLTERGGYCSKTGCKLAESGHSPKEIVRIDCEKCEGYREVYQKQVGATLPLCDRHMRLRHNERQRELQAKKRGYSPKYIRVDCEKCNGHRMVFYRNRNSALPLCKKHLAKHKRILNAERYKKQPPKQPEKPETPSGIFVLQHYSDPYSIGAEFDATNIRSGLRMGVWNEGMHFSTPEGEYIVVGKQGERQQLVDA